MSISSSGVRLDPLTAGLMQTSGTMGDVPEGDHVSPFKAALLQAHAKTPPAPRPVPRATAKEEAPEPVAVAEEKTEVEAPAEIKAEPEDSAKESGGFWSDGLPSLADIIDILNPLQHIPVVSSIYRAVTGDTESTGSSVAGGALYGGVIGLLAAFVDSAIKDATGQDMGEHALAMFDGPAADKTTDVAAAESEDAPDEMPEAVPVAASDNPALHYTLAQLRNAHYVDLALTAQSRSVIA